MEGKYEPIVGDVVRPRGYPDVKHLIVDLDLEAREVYLVLLKQDESDLGELHKVIEIGVDVIRGQAVFLYKATKAEKVLYGL